MLNDDVMGIIKNKVSRNDEDWIHDFIYSDFKIIKILINKHFYNDLFTTMSYYVVDNKIYKNGKCYKKNVISKSVKDYCNHNVELFCKVDTDELFKGNLKTNKVEIYKFSMSLCEKEKVMEIWNDVLKKYKPPCDCCKERNNELYRTYEKTNINNDNIYEIQLLAKDFSFTPIPFVPNEKRCENCFVPLLNENEIYNYLYNNNFDDEDEQDAANSLINLHYEIDRFISIDRYKYNEDTNELTITDFDTTFPKSFAKLVKHNKKMLIQNINKFKKEDILKIYRSDDWYLELPEEIDRPNTTKKRMKELILNEWN